MPAFNFHARFARAVERGEKRQTIRATRKHLPRVGQTAYLFTGMRTRACRRLGAEPIVRVEEIEIGTDGVIWLPLVAGEDGLYALSGPAADEFARADGLESADELVGWIARTHGLPFRGFVTYW